MFTIVLDGKEYRRNYQPNYCLLCGKRIQFRLDAKGVPESSDKYNKRKGCSTSHGRKIQQMRLRAAPDISPIDKFLYGGYAT